MVNYSFYILAKKQGSENVSFKACMSEWHELLYTMCPVFSNDITTLGFDRATVLDATELEMLDQISFDEQAMSITEEYETYRAPNYYDTNAWIRLIKKIEQAYLERQKEKYFTDLKLNIDDEKGLSRAIRQIRVDQFQFVQIKQTLEIARDNNMEVAFTIADY